jgi:hypothetical protein
MIDDHTFLDAYESPQKGDPDRLTGGRTPTKSSVRIGPSVDELLLDLHMIKHGYTIRRLRAARRAPLKEACADVSVVQRVKAERPDVHRSVRSVAPGTSKPSIAEGVDQGTKR